MLTSVMMWSALALLGCVTALWLLSLRLRDASIVDLFWGMGFVIVAAISALLGAGPDARRYLLLSLVGLWGLRLSGYLTWRNWGAGEDKRYAAMRRYHGERFWWRSLFTVFWLQGALVWVIGLPIMVAASAAGPAELGWPEIAGGIVWAIGLAFESIGDYQLARFKANPENSGKVMARGLWRYTRHPNYFGDAVVWWGLYLVSTGADGSWWTAFSPLLMTTLLLRVSGVAMLEKTIVKRRPAYQHYMTTTSAFVPWPPRRASNGRPRTG